jgi:hypothetical protein
VTSTHDIVRGTQKETCFTLTSPSISNRLWKFLKMYCLIVRNALYLIVVESSILKQNKKTLNNVYLQEAIELDFCLFIFLSAFAILISI